MKAYLESLSDKKREEIETAGVENANDFMKGLMRGKGKDSAFHWMAAQSYVLEEVLREE